MKRNSTMADRFRKAFQAAQQLPALEELHEEAGQGGRTATLQGPPGAGRRGADTVTSTCRAGARGEPWAQPGWNPGTHVIPSVSSSSGGPRLRAEVEGEVQPVLPEPSWTCPPPFLQTP